MRVRVLLFALYREQAGVRELLLDLAEGASVHSAQAALMARYPALSLHGGLAAVNQKFAQGGETLKEGDEVAFLPPVSGGGDAAKDNSYGLTEEKLDLEAYLSWASAPPYGAVVSFLGTTRSPNKGSDIAYLDYEAYSGMAEQVMADLAAKLAGAGNRHVLIVISFAVNQGQSVSMKTALVPFRAACPGRYHVQRGNLYGDSRPPFQAYPRQPERPDQAGRRPGENY